MIRPHENPVALKAGAFSLLVHVLLLGLLLISFNWKVVQPASIATVELWSELPSKPVVAQPIPEPPKPVSKPLPELEPKPVSKPESKADIEVKKEPPKPEPPKPKEEPKKPEVKKPVVKKPPQDDALEKLKQAMLEDQPNLDSSSAPAGPPAMSAEQQGEVNEFINKIRNKVHQNVNQQLCGSGNPELEFAMSLAPTGEIVGTPRMLKGSGIAACDESVERAILLAQPLPVPKEADLFARFRDLKLKFHPKGGN
ncbi:MAG: TonB C-terminal domain-containing protein [Betaproteobacteria bacterium HGW-Betaproteobacteria-1]|jgi:colicin import membrane protein|nr:MAG: TonB C-terminal domain-containing protein [Betaproteobacteria bacterium HGW-Betaproteobacteria-1]